MKKTKVTFISDTHNRQYDIYDLTGGDILVFSGDAMGSGYNKKDLEYFLQWFKEQPYKYKVYVPGNHDRFCENNSDEARKMFEELYDCGVRYLIDEFVLVGGVKIYGTPYQPYFCNWAFNVKDSKKLTEIYKKIPEGIDILVTHCPPKGILDRSHLPRPYYGTTGEEPLGSQELTKVLQEMGKKAPRYVAFGHIHGDGGNVLVENGITYINASVCDEGYRATNKVITLEIEAEGDK